MHLYIFFVTTAPDEPYLLSMYPMAEESDFAQQTLDDFLITEERRVICCSQPIYEDSRLETDEYAGLSLGVAQNEQTTVFTTVKSMYDQASIDLFALSVRIQLFTRFNIRSTFRPRPAPFAIHFNSDCACIRASLRGS